ncbi:MAG: hypothetical protein H7Y05_01740 [Steroidobacteraceae bacterium]|nr:hypothetical protein [Deltaproteobacteria bacterium]
MRRFRIGGCLAIIASLFLLLSPIIGHAQAEETGVAPPPIEQELVREGSFALRLAPALSLEASEDEAEAESRLADAGIMPTNGWIADYPVTPDIIAELHKSVSDAADAGKLPMKREEALKRFEEVKAELGLSIKPHEESAAYSCKPPNCGSYPDPAVINNYYMEEGPPVVTYYTPPSSYYHLYGWVPSPFWWSGFWFPGFFILNDFHQSVFVRDRVFFVSNHFNDLRRHRVFRIDPAERFRGRTFAGIGVTNPRGFISTGIPRSSRVIFNDPHRTAPSIGRSTAPSNRGGRSFIAPSRGGGTSGEVSRGGRTGGSSLRGGGGSGGRSGGGGGSRRR